MEPKTQSELIREIHKDVREITLALFGDGKKGLLDRMRLVEKTLAVILAVPAISLAVYGMMVAIGFHK